ncbi:pyrimidine/purine nucleoside phosphorylase [Magnetofaba australis]|uniref:Pyrimidine/purine nucleoside phosphorylase n=1 Tax=Magnetofaba australis IT-1 TaxID=1434232 RepID=A0A1Y2K251_9PROT|nr:pyrimidine/purine nucleoside phosphorylase [Magnetofaba australis]OSM02110.1 hypothetical protein MAIT1_02199 [Magnetofaba australis IT-1]
MFAVNSYFEDHVKSLAFQADGQRATVGVMAPGEYTFAASEKETMQVVSGSMTVKLPGEPDWQVFRVGEIFVVQPGESFDLKIASDTAYLCLYG